MKKTNQIQEREAIQRFRSHLTNNSGNINLSIPLAKIADWLQTGVGRMLFEIELELLQSIMDHEVRWLTGERYRHDSHILERWGTAQGSVIIHGQKVKVQRPRVRDGNKDVKLGSYELFSMEGEIQRQVWSRVMRGLTMREYDAAVRKDDRVFGLSKSTISERFIMASKEHASNLLKRDLSLTNLCVLMVDDVKHAGKHFILALGIDRNGDKTILGFQAGTMEDPQACDRLFADFVSRGLNSKQNFLSVIGAGAAALSIRKHFRPQPVQLSQSRLRQTVIRHFAGAQPEQWDRRLAKAYDMLAYEDAMRAMTQIYRDMTAINPRAARSLEEGLESTLTLHRLGVPAELRRVLRSTELIQSACSIVNETSQKVKRWRDHDHRERWMSCALILAEQGFGKISGHQGLPKLLRILQTHGANRRKILKAA